MADLDHIRALLVAQTAETEPRTRGLFDRLFTRRPEPAPQPQRPMRYAAILDLEGPVSAEAPAAQAEPELLLEHTLRPGLGLEEASRLRPPAPRGAFGRRPDSEIVLGAAETPIAREPELVLDRPAAGPRRLQLLDVAGQPVGEMILQPDAPREEVPYFPEDLLDHGGEPPLYELLEEPQPLRPWLKSLRGAGRPPPDPDSADETVVELAPPSQRRPRTRRPAPPKFTPSPPRPLGEDLLEALAITLGREHEALADRLLTLA